MRYRAYTADTATPLSYRSSRLELKQELGRYTGIFL